MTCFERGDRFADILGRFHDGAVDGIDDVTRFKATRFGGTSGNDLRNKRAFICRETECLSDFRTDRLDRNTEPTAVNAPIFAEVCNHI